MDSAMELDTLSRKCLGNGDVFLILDLPEKSIVGHDSLAITANNTKELGFRDIPEGAHFLWVSVPNAVSRCGYWYVTPEGRKSVRVKQWDSYNEVLGAPGSQFEVREKKANLESIYPKLIPYDYNGKSGNTESGSLAPRKSLLRSASSLSLDVESLSPRHALWQYLTWEIDETTLARITGKRATNDWLVDTSDAAKGEMQFDLRFAHSGGAALKKIIGSEFNFLFSQDIADLQIVDKVSTDSDDTTPRILAHLVRVGAESHILADLQFTFLTGMHLSNLACIEHWWALVLKIILRAYRLLLTNAKLCYRLLETIHAQLVYNEKYLVGKSSEGGASRDNTAGEWMDGGEGILETIPLYKSKLRKAVQEYKRKVDEILCGSTPRRTTEHAEVADAAAELEEWFSNHVREDKRRTGSTAADRQDDDGDDGVLVDRDNDSEDDDDAPVIVELDESGREVGLVSFDRD
ncbi:putative aar2 protein [Diplogelasinospora grovesii]|uniref:Aar2 protein n=1 Tax=Diplogelasinospora grovesii TaxID=303347 RepID=A0AAN6N4G2_9PEZI|nr:putative aar2 protein [Diplogelasinospora grovesii]